MPKKKINGIEIYYELLGNGPLLALVGGYTCTISMWEACLEYFKPHFTLLLLENRGAGRTEAPNFPYTIDQMAEDVIQLVKSLKFEKYSIVGHSMGGAIAQVVAYKDLKKINKTVIANSAYKFSLSTRALLHFFLQLRKDGVSDSRLNEGIVPLLFSDLFMSNPQQIYKLLFDEKKLFMQSIEGQKNQLHAVDSFDSQNFISKIISKTLIIGSENDRLTPFKESVLLSEKIPHSHIYCFKDMGHVPLIETPEKFSNIIIDFLQTA